MFPPYKSGKVNLGDNLDESVKACALSAVNS